MWAINSVTVPNKKPQSLKIKESEVIGEKTIGHSVQFFFFGINLEIAVWLDSSINISFVVIVIVHRQYGNIQDG